HDAMLSESAPVTIADVGDDPTFGAAGDGTGLLWALIDLGAQNAALGVIVDTAAVADAVHSGVGSELKIDVGGTVDRRAGYPINVTARVRRIADGCVESADRCVQNVGRAVLLDVQGRHGGRIDVILTERPPVSVETGLFRALGVDLTNKKIIGVKRTTSLRDVPTASGSQVLVTSTPGITTPLLHYFNWEHVSRPMHPLDPT
ncbi:MAG: MlrC C-terminal domain-containing protein, partial [Nitrolancea sp.]